MDFTIDQVVARFVALRDEIKALEDAHAEAMKPYRAKREVLEQYMLGHLNRENVEAVRTQAGTAYRSTTLSATVADWDALLMHVLGGALHRALDAVEAGADTPAVAEIFARAPELAFLIRGVNKTAVTEFMAANQDAVPPGVNIAQVVKLGVRRA